MMVPDAVGAVPHTLAMHVRSTHALPVAGQVVALGLTQAIPADEEPELPLAADELP
jgi:hypothetical protein